MDSITAVRLIAIPLIAAATGYLTNYIAVRMLFRPQREWRFAGLSLQGLIPKRRSQIAHSVAETIHAHLISHDDIKEAFGNSGVDGELRRLLDERLTTFLRAKVAGSIPMGAMLLGGGLMDRIKNALMEEVAQALPEITDHMIARLEEELDFKELVIAKIEAFDLDMFEQIVLRIAHRELRAIELLGGALGLVIGLLTDALLLL